MGLFKKLKRRFTKTNPVLERLRRDNFISPSVHLSHANTLELDGATPAIMNTANNRSYVNNRPIRWQRKSGFKTYLTKNS